MKTSGLPRLCRIALSSVALFIGMASCSDSETGPTTPPPNLFAAYSEPAWHPQSTSIYFSHTPLTNYYKDPATGRYVYVFDESLSGTWIVSSDGTGQRRVLSSSLHEPHWSRAGTRIAYSRQATVYARTGDSLSLDTLNEVALTEPGLRAFAPSWSPDGNQVAFSVHTGSPGLYVVPASGGPSRAVGASGWQHPDWSPDNKEFVFVNQESTGTWIGVADTSGANSQMIWASTTASASYPRWSPNGDRIAFTGRASNAGKTELWIMGSDGANARAMTSSGVLEYFSWSPNGEEVAYVRFDRGDVTLANGTIWILNTVSGSVRQVTTNTPAMGP